MHCVSLCARLPIIQIDDENSDRRSVCVCVFVCEQWACVLSMYQTLYHMNIFCFSLSVFLFHKELSLIVQYFLQPFIILNNTFLSLLYFSFFIFHFSIFVRSSELLFPCTYLPSRCIVDAWHQYLKKKNLIKQKDNITTLEWTWCVRAKSIVWFSSIPFQFFVCFFLRLPIFLIFSICFWPRIVIRFTINRLMLIYIWFTIDLFGISHEMWCFLCVHFLTTYVCLCFALVGFCR